MRSITLLALFVFGVSLLTADDEQSFIYKPIENISATTIAGETFSLQQYCKNKPTFITLAYSSCTGICYPFLFVLRDKVADLNSVKDNFQVLVLSFDSSDTKENMNAMASTLQLQKNSHWKFATINKKEIPNFISSVGFSARYDSVKRQYDHPPIVIGVNKQGKIVRIEKKYELTSTDLWTLYREIDNEYVPFYKENSGWLTCFTYDAKDGKFEISWGMLVLYFPVVVGFGIVYFIFRSANKRPKDIS